MKIPIIELTLVTICVFFAAACGQDPVEWPDDDLAGGECGSWYPGAPDPEAGTDDTGAEFGIEEGIFPCAVWESVKLAGNDTYLNVGEEHLRTKYGYSDKKALIIPVSARS